MGIYRLSVFAQLHCHCDDPEELESRPVHHASRNVSNLILLQVLRRTNKCICRFIVLHFTVVSLPYFCHICYGLESTYNCLQHTITLVLKFTQAAFNLRSLVRELLSQPNSCPSQASTLQRLQELSTTCGRATPYAFLYLQYETWCISDCFSSGVPDPRTRRVDWRRLMFGIMLKVRVCIRLISVRWNFSGVLTAFKTSPVLSHECHMPHLLRINSVFLNATNLSRCAWLSRRWDSGYDMRLDMLAIITWTMSRIRTLSRNFRRSSEASLTIA